MAVPGALQGGLLRTLFCLALSIPALPSAGAAEQAGTLEVDVGSGPLAPALQQWARQSGIALLFDARELDGLRTAGTHGHRDAAAALKELGCRHAGEHPAYACWRIRRPPHPPRATIAAVGRGTRHACSTCATQDRRRSTAGGTGADPCYRQPAATHLRADHTAGHHHRPR